MNNDRQTIVDRLGKHMACVPEQKFRNGEIHHWYRLVLGYADHLVADLLRDFGVRAGSVVLDPFCGSGTTAVECMKHGVDCYSVDSNPASCFATRVKTNWNIDATRLDALRTQVLCKFGRLRSNTAELRKDKTYRYIKTAGMIKRGWIRPSRLFDVLALKSAVQMLPTQKKYKDLLLLAITNTLVHSASNVRFGPELYCGSEKDVIVVEAFNAKVGQIMEDLLTAIAVQSRGTVTVVEGDSRDVSADWFPKTREIDAVICSPPYPVEHDYTRNSRLELALIESVFDRDSLRSIKRAMIRSHTKGIYVEDGDSATITGIAVIRELARKIDRKAADKTYGFARLYGRVVKEYFGGMHRHFTSLLPLLRPGAKCAYVVGDQASYFQVPVSTAAILAEVATCAGFKVAGIQKWRERWATGSGKRLDENILLLEKPSAYKRTRNQCPGLKKSVFTRRR